MNKNKTYVPTEFGPETRFELRATPPAPFRATQETEFERLKNKLLAQQLRAATPELNVPLRRAANDAAALAWATVFPAAGVPGAVRGKNRGRRAPPPAAGAHLRQQPARRRMKTRRQRSNVTGDKWQVRRSMSPVTCHPPQFCGAIIFGARTVPRRGVSSIRLRRHCPRS